MCLAKRHSLLALAVIFGIALAVPVVAIEEAAYRVVREGESCEIRRYSSQVVAETRVKGQFSEAGNDAFRPLFQFISGANAEGEDIAMTAPVAQSRGTRIDMTAPVTQVGDGEEWVVSFLMPAELSMETVPVPTDSRVHLREIPARRMAAVRYSGRWTEKRFRAELAKLLACVDENGLTAIGEPVWARYNSPFSLPFLRRNEILVELAPDAKP